jgi:hypothetical protein
MSKFLRISAVPRANAISTYSFQYGLSVRLITLVV